MNGIRLTTKMLTEMLVLRGWRIREQGGQIGTR